MTAVTRTLNRLVTSAIGLGCMGMRFEHEDQCRRTLERAVERGTTLFDTADIYGRGANERLVGRLLAEHRERLVVATKFGGYSLELAGRTPDGRPEYVHAACDASLRRLGYDHIDLYYLHRVDPQVPIEETVGAMAELVDAGKVRHLGLSEAGSETIRRAHATHPITAVQSEYSLWTRDIEEDVLPTLRELGIGLVAYGPLGHGFLAGHIRSLQDLEPGGWHARNPRFQAENLRVNVQLVAALQQVADERGVTPAQLALAWVLAKGDDIVPIFGTTQPRRVDENLAALDLQLSRGDLDRLESAFPPGAAAGDRYPPAEMRTLFG